MFAPFFLLWQGTGVGSSSFRASFTGTPLSVTVGTLVTFTPVEDTRADSYQWDDSNDGTYDYTNSNPIPYGVIYTSVGTYSVRLTIANASAGLIDTTVITDYVNVVATPTVPSGVFVASPLSGTVPLCVTFTASCSGPLSQIYWDPDNDGDYDSFGSTTTFVFTSVGTYSPRMILIGTGGYDSTVSGVTINAVSAPLTPSTSAVSWQPWRARIT